MKIKVSEATERQLDWLASLALGHSPKQNMHSHGMLWEGLWESTPNTVTREYRRLPRYSTDWSQGGPIIERMFSLGLRLHTNEFMPRKDGPLLIAASLNGDAHAGFYFGPTALIAAIRCDVASKLGDEVEVPEELS